MNRHKNRVLIADDHRVVVEGIRAGLAGHPEFEVCGWATDGLEAVELAVSLRPEIVILDISMPRMNGLDAAREIMRIDDAMRIVIFSMHADPEYILFLYEMGVSAYVLKDSPLTELIAALKRVRNGERSFSGTVGEVLTEHRPAGGT